MSMQNLIRPVLTDVYHPTGERFAPVWLPLADFSRDPRPAYRVECHCRNCAWKGQARFETGRVISLWLYCPQCECLELSAHGDFIAKDLLSDAEARAKAEAILKERREAEDASWRRQMDRLTL